MFKAIMRIFSYLYHLVLGLFLLAVGAIAFLGQSVTLKLDMLPWSDPALTQWVFWGSLAGLISLVLAVTGKFRWAFRAWALVVLGFMAYGFFLSRYAFTGADHFRDALLLTFGAILAVIGSMYGGSVRRRA